ncbi:MAG TPA: hypothetical protein PLL18_17625 [Flavobacteriales bacterium]|nr:hypothetical protein [Flavobacteriales bacterium]
MVHSIVFLRIAINPKRKHDEKQPHFTFPAGPEIMAEGIVCSSRPVVTG